MTDSSEVTEIVITVTRKSLGNHNHLTVFDIETSAANSGVWPESFGSLDSLRAFLKGTEVALRMAGWMVNSLAWDIPGSWSSPYSVRFIIKKNELTETQTLREDGSVVEL